MSTFQPSPDKLSQLEQRMAALGISESDMQEDFVRSGGPGGQKVNKSSSCVMLVHKPSGLRVKCQTTRHQAMNRFLARQMLLDKIEHQRRSEAAARRSELEKARRQKRKRPRNVKEQILKSKARHSQKKAFRRRDFGE